MKKFFKEINKWRLFFSCLSIIMCVLMTTFLILCHHWYFGKNLLLFSIYICFCCYNFAFGSLFIISTFHEVLEFIDNKKQKAIKLLEKQINNLNYDENKVIDLSKIKNSDFNQKD